MFEVIKCKVNGKNQEIAINSGESLTDLLRNKLGLTSVKKGCEVGECGACTVLIDGKAFNSCIYLASWANNKSITTVEGLTSTNGELSLVQKSFIEEAAVQCGFCTPGIILTATEIVNRKQKYSKDELRTLISGHLCRCTGYENILNAVEKAVNKNI